MLVIREIDHVVLRVSDADSMIRFYCEVLGAKVSRRRPDLGMVHLRAGASLIDLVDVAGPLRRPGAGPTAVRLGMPEVGLLARTEMIDKAARIADASGLPLIADADNGYGGVLNVRRTIQGYERAGAAAVHLEDQVIPKRCGHLAGKQLVPGEEMTAKIRAAVDAPTDRDFVLIATTDAIAVEGFDAARERRARRPQA